MTKIRKSRMSDFLCEETKTHRLLYTTTQTVAGLRDMHLQCRYLKFSLLRFQHTTSTEEEDVEGGTGWGVLAKCASAMSKSLAISSTESRCLRGS